MKTKATLVFTTLIDMTAAGELGRTGVGEAALYRIRKLRPVGSQRFGRFRTPRAWTFGFFDTKRSETFEDN